LCAEVVRVSAVRQLRLERVDLVFDEKSSCGRYGTGWSDWPNSDIECASQHSMAFGFVRVSGLTLIERRNLDTQVGEPWTLNM
jgi:hypothetical protein